MVSEEALRYISEIFIGDTECYSYKSGGDLVEFLISILVMRIPINQAFPQGGTM